jgi:hypothetical protein
MDAACESVIHRLRAAWAWTIASSGMALARWLRTAAAMSSPSSLMVGAILLAVFAIGCRHGAQQSLFGSHGPQRSNVPTMRNANTLSYERSRVVATLVERNCSEPPRILASNGNRVRVSACGEELSFTCGTETTYRWSYIECCESHDGLAAGGLQCFVPARTWPNRRSAQVVAYEKGWTEPSAVIRNGYD